MYVNNIYNVIHVNNIIYNGKKKFKINLKYLLKRNNEEGIEMYLTFELS